MVRISKLEWLTGSILATLVISPVQAFAQESGSIAAGSPGEGREGEIVVTARKRSERLIDVPETIQAFSEASLEKAGISNMDKLGQAIPNVVLNRRGDNEPNVVIRGIGSFGNVQGIGFYVDDVQNFTDQATRLVDLERVEVLKGPQGTLYGGSSIGGAVKYVTKKPSQEFEGSAAIDLGEQSILNIRGSINVPFSQTFAARISGYVDANDGFMRNGLTGVNNDKSKEYGVRAAFRFTPTEDTDINLSLRTTYLDNGGNDYYLTPKDTTYLSRQDLNENVFNKRRIFGGILSIEQQLGGMSLTSLTSFTERRVRRLLDVEYSPVDVISVRYSAPVKSTVFTQELRLASDKDEGLNWLIGGNYTRFRNRSSSAYNFDAYFSANFDGGPFVIEDYNNTTDLEQTLAGFADLIWKSGGFEATLGARLNSFKYYGRNRNVDPDSATVKDTTVLPKLTLSYKVDPAVMLYATAAEGYEPGRFKLSAFNPIIPYKPERAMNFEVGAKGQTADSLFSYEVAGFYIKSKNRQLEALVLDDQGIPQEGIGNVGDARTIGAEFSFTLRPSRELSISANGGWMNSKFTAGLFDGMRVPYAPHFSGGAAIDYTVDLSDAMKLSVRADVSHNSGFFWDTDNMLSQESYDLVGLRLAVGAVDDRWELAVRADNLFNEKYNLELQPWDETSVLARRGQPRLVVGSFTVRF
jgi:iron complex outermembrane receptor protein